MPGLRAALAKATRLKCRVIVSKLDRLSCDLVFISGLMARGVPFIVAELGADVNPFVLHLFAALGQKERQLISQRTQDALGPMVGTGQMGNKTHLTQAQAKGCAGNAATSTGGRQPGHAAGWAVQSGQTVDECNCRAAERVEHARDAWGRWPAKAVSRVVLLDMATA